MNNEQKKSSFFDGFDMANTINRRAVFSTTKRILTLFLFLFSSFFLNLEAKKNPQIPSSKLKVVVANASKNNPKKSKARVSAKKAKKPRAAARDTSREIDPLNVNSPLYQKNQI